MTKIEKINEYICAIEKGQKDVSEGRIVNATEAREFIRSLNQPQFFAAGPAVNH